MPPPTLGVYRMHPEVVLPELATEGAACFDIRAHFRANEDVKFWTESKIDSQRKWNPGLVKDELGLLIPKGARVLIPTGIIFAVPPGFSVRVHPRSSVALKRGLNLINNEGVIDWDYYHEAFVPIVNVSNSAQRIEHGERIAQCELVPVLNYSMSEATAAPGQLTERVGGFGSTGTH